MRDFDNVPVIWEPEEDSGKRIKGFNKSLERKYNVHLADFWDLHKWSIENLTEFWEEIWNYVGVIHSEPYEKVIDLSVSMEDSPEWFPGARLNYAENLLKYRDDHIALIAAGEDREDIERVTYAQMYEESRLYAAALRKMGVKKGDRVSCYMSNRKEAVFAMLATTSIGAIWLGSLPFMKSQAVVSFFEQVQPKVMFTVDRFLYDKEETEMLSKVREIATGLPSLEKVIIVPTKPETKLKDISGIKNSCFLDDFLETGKNRDGTVPEMEFEQVPLSHPVFISYTSGTTGLPKALIHGFGFLLCKARDFYLHIETDRSSVWLAMIPVGWASWNFFTAMFFIGSTIVLFDGMPYYVHPTFLWDMVDELKITHLFLAPIFLNALEKKGYLPTKKNHLQSLKMVLSTGSIVKKQNFDFACKKIKSDMIFSSAYGSTELMGYCMIMNHTLRIHRGEITAPSLGVDIVILDDTGKPLLGEIGELAINKPLPSMPLGLWGDMDRSIFKNTYFEKFPGKFCIGDLAMINPVTRGIIVCGRSDGTLKPAGWRYGSSEIYNIVDNFPEVLDSLCVSQFNKDGDERAVLFLKMRNGCLFTENLVKRIITAIEREVCGRHIPAVILETQDIPHNMNGKKMEIIVKNIISGMSYNPETVINPECLENFKDIPELQGF